MKQANKEQTSEEELVRILTTLENHVAADVARRLTSNSSGTSPKARHSEAVRALIAWKDAAVVEARKEERLAAESDFGFTEEDEQHQRELCKAIESKGVVYMSLQTGRVITEEAYWEFREWVDAVGKPEGSVVEQHLKIDIAQLT